MLEFVLRIPKRSFGNRFPFMALLSVETQTGGALFSDEARASPDMRKQEVPQLYEHSLFFVKCEFLAVVTEENYLLG
jgi:hypothetical protein